MLKEMGALFYMAQEAVGAQGLHEALHGAKQEDLVEIPGDILPTINASGNVVLQKLVPLWRDEGHVRVKQEASQIILGQPRTESLKIDQVGSVLMKQNVLGLEITVDENLRQLGQAFSYGTEGGSVDALSDPKMASQAIFKEIFLLPEVKGGIELRLE